MEKIVAKFSVKIFLISLVVLLCSQNVFAEKRFPYMGRVNGSRVNVRGGAGLNFGILTQLKQGEDVVIIEETDEWCKMKLPHGCSAWVFAKLIKNGKVNRDTINVRSGPGSNYAVLANLLRGESVFVLDDIGEWVKIEPPVNAGAWAYKQYITYLAPVDDYQDWLKKEKKAQVEFKELEAFRKEELFKSIEDIDFELLIEKYETFIEEYPTFPETKQAENRILDTKAKQEVAMKTLGPLYQPKDRNLKPEKVIITKEKERKPKEKSYSGKLLKLKKEVEGNVYYLKSSGFLFSRKLCILKADNVDLSSLENRKITILGKEISRTKGNIPIVELLDIDLKDHIGEDF